MDTLACSQCMGLQAQLVDHCSANAEATGSNPVEAPKIFFSGFIRNCLNYEYNCDGHIFISVMNLLALFEMIIPHLVI